MSDLHSRDENPRTISPERFENLRRAIAADPEFLRLRPVLARTDGLIYCGNQRYLAAVANGATAVPAILEALSGATCASCGGKGQRPRSGACAAASPRSTQAAWNRRSGAREVEARFGEWLGSALVLAAPERTRLAALVREKVRGGDDADKAGRMRAAIKRLSDAYTWGGLEEDAYRQQLADLRAQLERSERVPDERRILEAVRIAQDVPCAWQLATSTQRRRMASSTFERIRIAEGRVVAVRPRLETAPLLALRVSSLPRSRPETRPFHRTDATGRDRGRDRPSDHLAFGGLGT